MQAADEAVSGSLRSRTLRSFANTKPRYGHLSCGDLIMLLNLSTTSLFRKEDMNWLERKFWSVVSIKMNSSKAFAISEQLYFFSSTFALRDSDLLFDLSPLKMRLFFKTIVRIFFHFRRNDDQITKMDDQFHLYSLFLRGSAKIAFKWVIYVVSKVQKWHNPLIRKQVFQFPRSTTLQKGKS